MDRYWTFYAGDLYEPRQPARRGSALRWHLCQEAQAEAISLGMRSLGDTKLCGIRLGALCWLQVREKLQVTCGNTWEQLLECATMTFGCTAWHVFVELKGRMISPLITQIVRVRQEKNIVG